ncbi:MAG: GAF domain-containing protein, partial [Chloroflexi bacterium]|nr:GAF domain-containing protein [Chloroflexota bacterium]
MKLDEEGRLLTLVKSPPDSAEFKSAYSTVGKRLRQAIILRGLYEELFVIDSNGVIILSTNIFQEGKTLRNEPSFQQILQEVSLQPPAFSETLGHFSVLATRPITEQGKPLGALLGRAGLAVLDGFVSDRNGMGRTGEIYLVNPGFVLLTETHFGTPGSTLIRTNATNAAINGHTTGAAVYSSYRATLVVGHYRWLPDLQLALIAEQEQSEAFENSRFLLLVGSSISAVLITIAMIAAFFITRSISNPIVEMAQVAEQIEAGNLDRTVNIHRDDEIGTLATAFNNMITRLRGLIGSLEMRVADRTKALAASTEVSRRLSTILDEQSLVSAVVDEVQSAFNYYHAHIYLLDAAGENLIMMGGTGDVGRLMLMRGHSLPVGRGLVGRAAAKSETVLVPDVSKDPQWLPNTLLPDTRAEAAVPITLGSKVLGVLDIQHNIVNGLQPDDIDLLQAIASQVAIGLQNARSYTQAQRQADYESMLNAINEKIQTATTIEDVTQIAARELGQALGASRISVQIGKTNAVLITVITLLTVLQVSLTNQLGANMQGLSHSTANNVANHVASEIARLQLLARNQTIINDVRAINTSYGGSEPFALEQIQKLDAKWITAAQNDPLLTLGQSVTSAAELRQFTQADPNNFDLVTTDRYGGTVAHTTPPSRFDLRLESWRVAAYSNGKGAVYIGPASYDAARGFYLTLAVPIFTSDGAEVIGTLHTRYRLTAIVNQLGQASGHDKTIDLYLVSADGTRLDTASGNVQISLEERSYLTQDTWRTGSFGSVPSLIAYSLVSFSPGIYDELRLPWTIIARQDLDRSLAPVQSTVLLVIVFAVIGLVVAILFTFFVANELVRPLAE